MCVLATVRKDGTPIEWEQAKGFGKYLISTDGQIYSVNNDKLLLQGQTEKGYMHVDVYNDNGLKKHMKVHRLVYMAHVGEIPTRREINHIDECKTNNCIENLELMTHRENCNYGTANKRRGKTLKKLWAKKCQIVTC